ncbi:Glu/Leu/Phe/Val dehydrogenase dimerization domain-containing protein [Rhizohabitans arisaemae]|uniref:Glu/Leu/Phe/Val dehydrogenase dimerization domain-containing protein n=1 Tax=Rhizohabitans arisaemae TaxID=2720610 RepID=UPI0024B20635|nr:Glu/Leu/Phe/Val dehydrogenase dimerization domain-containing protein [Rhizohabitans arisaemae]
MRVVELTDGFLAFDLDCMHSVGGTRLALDVTREETALIARAMTYRHAVLGRRIGGAGATLRAEPESRARVISRYVEEIHPLADRRSFLTVPDLGTRPEDFHALPAPTSAGGSDPVDDGPGTAAGGRSPAATALGVVAAAEIALGGLRGRTAAIEGFGVIGSAVAAALAARGCRVVAVSTRHGSVRSPSGLDVPGLIALRERYGAAWPGHASLAVHPPAALFTVPADLLVPAARTGVLDEDRSAGLDVAAIAPAAHAPYTEAGLEVLRRRGVVALADFVCNAGAGLGPQAGRTVADLTLRTLRHDQGPYAGARELAEDFLRTWLPPAALPVAPPLAP